MNIRIASTWRQRMKGLLNTSRSKAKDEVLMLIPCRSIHTIGMSYRIDIAFIDSMGVVLYSRRSLPPGIPRVKIGGAVAVLERPADEDRAWYKEGERLSL